MDVKYWFHRILFTWDSDKNHRNRSKHGVSFDDASEAFFDPFLRTFEATVETGEGREVLIGMTESWRLLYIVYVARADAFRIISARAASAAERKLYEEE